MITWWKHLRVKTKFLMGMTAIFIAILFSFSFFYVTLDRQNERTASMHSAAALSQSLLEREMQHLRWVAMLSNYLTSPVGTPLTLEKNPTECSFGKWYYSEARIDSQHAFPEIIAELAKLEGPHRTLHESAVEIESLMQAGRTAEAERIFNDKTLAAFAELGKNFTILRDKVQRKMSTQREVMGELLLMAEISMLVLSVLVCIAVALVAITLLKNIFRPLEVITRYSEDCQKNSDSVLAVFRHDELGALAENLRQLMANLNKQLAFSKGVLNGLCVPCSIFSAQDTTVFTNQHMIDLLERNGTPDQYIGTSSGEFIWGDKAAETVSTRALRENKLLTARREFVTHKGNVRHASISSAPFHDEQGEILGTLSIWMEITEIVEKQKALEEHSLRVAELAASSTDVAGSVSSASTQLAAQVEQASRGAEKQRDRVSETATAMTQMNSSILEVAQNAQNASNTAAEAMREANEGAKVVDGVVVRIDKLNDSVEATRLGMDELGKQTKGIDVIINVIGDIADQTNLLALNAAIEAARAGDAGRGFAVVADEVRKLAEKTMEATKEVGLIVNGIQQGALAGISNVTDASRAMEEARIHASEAGNSLRAIVSLVAHTAGQVHSIATAAEEQSVASEQINQVLGDVDTISGETSTSMLQAAEAVEGLAKQADILRQQITTLVE